MYFFEDSTGFVSRKRRRCGDPRTISNKVAVCPLAMNENVPMFTAEKRVAGENYPRSTQKPVQGRRPGALLRIDDDFSITFNTQIDPEWDQYLHSVFTVVQGKVEEKRKGGNPDLTPLHIFEKPLNAGKKIAKKSSLNRPSKLTTSFVSPVPPSGSSPSVFSPSQNNGRKRSPEDMDSNTGGGDDEGEGDNEQNGEYDDDEKNEPQIHTLLAKDDENLKKWYEACFKVIQQQACRWIAQDWIKVLHPKKQAHFPYSNNNKKNPDDEAKIPEWWPKNVMHREPAHLKIDQRMKLLLHIIYNLTTVMHQVYPKHEFGDDSDFLETRLLRAMEKATDENSKIQMEPRAVKWLKRMYSVKQYSLQAEQGGRLGSNIRLVWPDTSRKSRKKNAPRRQKIEPDYPVDAYMDIRPSFAENDGMQDDAGLVFEGCGSSDSSDDEDGGLSIAENERNPTNEPAYAQSPSSQMGGLRVESANGSPGSRRPSDSLHGERVVHPTGSLGNGYNPASENWDQQPVGGRNLTPMIHTEQMNQSQIGTIHPPQNSNFQHHSGAMDPRSSSGNAWVQPGMSDQRHSSHLQQHNQQFQDPARIQMDTMLAQHRSGSGISSRPNAHIQGGMIPGRSLGGSEAINWSVTNPGHEMYAVQQVPLTASQGLSKDLPYPSTPQWSQAATPNHHLPVSSQGYLPNIAAIPDYMAAPMTPPGTELSSSFHSLDGMSGRISQADHATNHHAHIQMQQQQHHHHHQQQPPPPPVSTGQPPQMGYPVNPNHPIQYSLQHHQGQGQQY